MQTLIEKFELVAEDLEKEYGELTLFGLFLREDSFEKWDVIVSAPWLLPDSQESYNMITTEIHKFIKNGNLVKLSRIAILSVDNPLVKLLQNTWTGKGLFQLPNPQILSDLLAFNIKSAYLLRSTKNN